MDLENPRRNEEISAAFPVQAVSQPVLKEILPPEIRGSHAAHQPSLQEPSPHSCQPAYSSSCTHRGTLLHAPNRAESSPTSRFREELPKTYRAHSSRR